MKFGRQGISKLECTMRDNRRFAMYKPQNGLGLKKNCFFTKLKITFISRDVISQKTFLV